MRGVSMRVGGLFAGVGGFECGLSKAGHEAVFLCEVWEPARAVLRARYPDVPCARDVSSLDALPRDIDVLVGGFPCQDLSQAGRTVGIGGERSGLVHHVFRLLDRGEVPWVVLENVSFMLSLDKGRALRTLIEAFERRGYRWAYRVVNSLGFLPQRRERVVFVATLSSVDPADVLLADDAAAPEITTAIGTHAHGFYWTEGIRGLGWAASAVPTLKNGSTVGIASPPAILLPSGLIVTPDIRDAERLQGFPEDWTRPAALVARPSLRWSLVGNAVTVPVATWLGERLKRPGVYDSGRGRELKDGDRWPRAARYDGTHREGVEIGPFPRWKRRPELHAFLKHEGKPLSARATRGFLERTSRGTLRFVPGFLDAVRQHLRAMEDAQRYESMPVAAE